MVRRFHTSAKRNNIRAHIGAGSAVSNFGSRLTTACMGAGISMSPDLRACRCSANRVKATRISASSSRNIKMRETTKQEGQPTCYRPEQNTAKGLVCLWR